MRCEFDIPLEAFSVLPHRDDDEADSTWVREQIDAYRSGPIEAAGARAIEYGEIVARAARIALECRTAGGTDLFFRPIDRLDFGVVHVVVDPTPADAADLDPVEWVLQGIDLRVDPVVGTFSTDVIREGWRVHYVTTRDTEDGDALAGFAFVFRQDGLTGLVYSELATVDSISEQLELTVPVVASLRLVP